LTDRTCRFTENIWPGDQWRSSLGAEQQETTRGERT
jgi:hypothetical protein